MAISALYAAVDLGARITAANGWVRARRFACRATAQSIGVRPKHFTGMLAVILPAPVSYRWPTVFLPLVAAILASLVILFVDIRERMDFVQALTGRCTPRARSGGGPHEPSRV